MCGCICDLERKQLMISKEEARGKGMMVIIGYICKLVMYIRRERVDTCVYVYVICER